MKKFLILIFIFSLGHKIFSFDIMYYPPSVSSGDILIDTGIGLSLGFYGSMKIPPLFVQAEYVLPNIPISIGGGITYWQNGYSTSYINYSYNYLAILLRGNWHWGFNLNWLDLYTGLSIGYNFFWQSYEFQSGYNNNPTTYNYGGIGYGFHIGSRFYFSKKIGILVELGYPMMKVGISFK